MAKKDKATINFTADEQMTAHLYKIIEKGGFGRNPTSAVKQLVWEGIRNLVRDGWILDYTEGEDIQKPK
ncbi:MAG: hypothetical protein CMP91_02370 [Gammaproteobacteria bacterium]|nr:hypothetical protein [Gammaproteobacteria bacterium]|tara:strand:+ start:141202 stop:141408 length:207 start_codon:yes stop_codon:yes gene_type:complete